MTNKHKRQINRGTLLVAGVVLAFAILSFPIVATICAGIIAASLVIEVSMFR